MSFEKWSHLYEIHDGWMRQVFEDLCLEKVTILVDLDNLNSLKFTFILKEVKTVLQDDFFRYNSKKIKD